MNFLKYALLFFAISFPLMIWAPDTASRRHSAAEPVRRDSDTILSWTAVVLAHQQGAYPNVVAVSDALSIVGQVSIASMATDYGVDLRVLPDAKSTIGVRRQVSSGSTFEQIVSVDPILQSISTIHDYSNPPIAHLSKGRMTAAIGVDYPSSIGFGAVVDSSGALTYSFDYATPLSSGASTVVTGPAPYDGWILKIAGRPNYVFMTTRHRVYRVDALNGTLIEVTSTQLSPGPLNENGPSEPAAACVRLAKDSGATVVEMYLPDGARKELQLSTGTVNTTFFDVSNVAGGVGPVHLEDVDLWKNDGRRVLLLTDYDSDGDLIRVVRLSSSAGVKILDRSFSGTVIDVACAPDGDSIFVLNQEGDAYIWSVATNTVATSSSLFPSLVNGSVSAHSKIIGFLQ